MNQSIDVGYFKNTQHRDSKEFTTEAQHFSEFGRYTNNPYNTSPKSKYYKYWVEQARRCVWGHNIGRDWIPGYYYHFLNFCPLFKAEEIQDDIMNQVGNMIPMDDPESDLLAMSMAERVEGFPDFWDGHYKLFHYYNDSELRGEHCSVIKSRTKGFSFIGGSMMNRNYHLLPGTKSYAFADDKEYLTEDGLLTKTWDIMDFITENTAWGKRRVKDTEMHKRAGYKINQNGLEIIKGFRSEIIGVSLHNNYNKARGKRGKLILFEECHSKGTKVFMYNGSFKNIEDIIVGDKIMGVDSKPRSVLKTVNGVGKMYNVKQSKGIDYKVTGNHLLHVCIRKHSNSYDGYRDEYRHMTPEQILNSNNYIKTQIRGIKSSGVEFDKKELNIDPYFMGLWLGDGSKRSVDVTTMDDEIRNYMYDLTLKNNLNIRVESKKGNKAQTYCLSNGRKWSGNNLLKALQYYNVHNNKHIHDDFIFNSKENRLQLLAGLIDSDGSLYNKGQNYVIATKDKDTADKIAFISRTLGYRPHINKNYRLRNGKNFLCYRVHISGNDLSEIPVLIQRKKAKPWTSNYNALFTKIKIVPGKEEQYYGITLGGDNLYMLEDLTITHNSGKNPHLLKAWNIALRSVAIGRKSFGLMIAFGTGGTEDADFMGLEQLFYEGGGYRVRMIPNEWDIGAHNQKCGFFYSAAQNYESTKKIMCMDVYGNSNFDTATSIILAEREKIKRETKNPEAIIRHIAEEPLNPQEAVLRVTGSLFPTNDLKRHLAHLRTHPSRYEATEYIGDLGINESGKIEWSPDQEAKQIRQYPHNNLEDTEGCIVIYEHPVPDKTGVIPYGVYIAGSDNYDHDQSTTQSLGSTFIMNRLTERIVAEYTGRPLTAPMYYEKERRLLMYYNCLCNYENNLKGLHGYFDKMHCTYLLCDTPPIIFDKLDDKSLMKRGKGTPGTKPIKKWGCELALIWLLTPVAPDSEVLNLHKIRSEALLQELIYHSKDGNFDRVDALIYLLIYKEQISNVITRFDRKTNEIDPFFADHPLFKENIKPELPDPFKEIKIKTGQVSKEKESILDYIPKPSHS